MSESLELLSVKKLYYFCEVARLQSFRSAARRLGISQPALTRHVQLLELGLGLVLLQRGQRATKLTEAGRLLFERSDSILRDLASLRAEMEGFDRRPMGSVTLAIPASFALAFLPRLLISFRSKFPEVKIRITEGSTRHVEEWITSRYADIGIIISNIGSGNFVTENLIEERLYLISRAAPAGVQTPVTMDVLTKLPLILPLPSQASRKLIDAAAATAGLRLVPHLEVDSPHIMRDILTNDEVFTVMPKSAFVRELEAGSLKATPIDSMPSRMLAIATLRDEPLSAATRALAREIRAIVNEIDRD